MANPFRLSPFRWGTFRRCRRQYKYRYVERLPTPPNPNDTMGQHVHAALRDLMARPAEERTAARAADLLRRRWATNRAGFRGLADEARWKARALEQIERFTSLPEAAGEPAALERYIEVDLDSNVRAVGRIDRIDMTGDGLHVIDYKTSVRPPDDAIDPGQLRLYAMMIRRTVDRPVARATYLYLEDGADWSERPSDQDIEAIADDAVRAVGEITRERDYEPTIGRYCAFCEFQRICPKRDEIVGRRIAEGW